MWDDYSKMKYLAPLILILLINHPTTVRADDYATGGPPLNMHIIMMIESEGDPHAVSKTGAVGLYQITPICLKDFIRFSKHEQEVNTYPNFMEVCNAVACLYREWTMGDMYDPIKNNQVAWWYMNTRIPQLLKHFGHKDTLENRLVAYQCGVKCVGKKLSRETRNYIKKYYVANRH